MGLMFRMEQMNSLTKKWVDAFIERPKTTLLIDCNNDSESGNRIAEHICAKLAIDSHVPIVRLSIDDKKSIGIDDVRDLQKSMQLKANNTGNYTRFVVVEDAEKLTIEAQNSLLKLMEELPAKTVLIIIASDISKLLVTVKSRCFNIPVLPISESQAIEYGLQNGHNKAKINKAYLLSEGYFSKFDKLLNDDDELYDLVDLAKKFIGDSLFERQAVLQTLASPKSVYTYEQFTHALTLTAKSGMRFASSKDTKTHWKNILVSVLSADDQVSKNVSEKLALLSLSVSI
jgi:DNA polymerase III gamma/tau subunit